MGRVLGDNKGQLCPELGRTLRVRLAVGRAWGQVWLWGLPKLLTT